MASSARQLVRAAKEEKGVGGTGCPRTHCDTKVLALGAHAHNAAALKSALQNMIVDLGSSGSAEAESDVCVATEPLVVRDCRGRDGVEGEVRRW